MSSNPHFQDYIRHLKKPAFENPHVSVIEYILPKLRAKYLRNPDIVESVLRKEKRPVHLARMFSFGSSFWSYEYRQEEISDEAALILKIMVGILSSETLGTIKINTDFRRSKFLRHCPTMKLRINKQ